MKKFLALLVAVVAMLAVPTGATAQVPQYNFCGIYFTSGGLIPGTPGTTCAQVYSSQRGNWMDLGNAQYNLAYRYLAGTGYDTQSESRRLLGIPTGGDNNAYATPTIYTRAIDNYRVDTIIDWAYPKYRKACRWNATVGGGNINFSVSNINRFCYNY